MDKYKKLASNTIVFAIGTFSSKLFTLVLTFFYTRVMATGDFGGATLIQNAVNILVPIVTLAVNSAALRFALDKGCNRKRVFTTGVATTLIGFAVFALFSPIVSKISINDFNFGRYTILLYLMLLGSSLRQLCQQFVRGAGYVKLYALDGVVATATSAGFTFLYLGAFRWGIYGYILAIFTSDMLSVAFLFCMARLWRYLDFRRGLKKSTVSPMLKYCIPLIPTIVLWWIINVSDQYMVTYFNGVSESGIYTAAYKIPNFVTIFSSIFIDAWQLSAVDEYDNDGKSAFFTKVFKVYSGALIAVGAVLITGSKLITGIYLGADYFESWQYEPILVIATTFSCLVNFYASVYMAEKKSVLSMITAGTGAVANIILNFILIPVYGPYGAAVTTAFSFVLVFVIRVFNTKKFVNIKLDLKTFLPSVFLLVASAAVMIFEVGGDWQSFGISLVLTLLIVAVNISSVKDIIQLLLGKFIKKRTDK
ncbi:MAG: polysaccharide biosynthesis C-terminal domain-containing protein [Clostridiales bacterium]|nr:polysaccharide biosynthesis C-terminal domain-containing protein [Clostridiales bacterium]